MVYISESDIITNKIQYLDNTHKFNDYNEIDNLNTNLLSTNNIEVQRLTVFNDQLKTKVMKYKQNYMLTDYSIHEISMYNNILAFTIIIVCLLIFCVVKVTTKKAMIWISVIVGIIYLIAIMIILKSNANRRSSSWSQWYWSPVIKKA